MNTLPDQKALARVPYFATRRRRLPKSRAFGIRLMDEDKREEYLADHPIDSRKLHKARAKRARRALRRLVLNDLSREGGPRTADPVFSKGITKLDRGVVDWCEAPAPLARSLK